jgi:hypothetical protein
MSTSARSPLPGAIPTKSIALQARRGKLYGLHCTGPVNGRRSRRPGAGTQPWLARRDPRRRP